MLKKDDVEAQFLDYTQARIWQLRNTHKRQSGVQNRKSEKQTDRENAAPHPNQLVLRRCFVRFIRNMTIHRPLNQSAGQRTLNCGGSVSRGSAESV